MTQEKQIKYGKRLQRMMRFFTKIQSLVTKRIGKVRFVETSQGRIKVLEYGFDSTETAPLYIDMHGGGFILGSADMDEVMNLYFKEKANVKIISIDYPKAPEKPYPSAIEAVYEVITHYIGNAAKYGVDKERYGIGGHSAGANLATVICMKAKTLGNFTFKFQLLDYPPLDLKTDPLKKPTPKKAISPKMAAAFNACYADAETAKSPYVSPVFAKTEQLAGMPPTLLIVAGYDSLHDEGVRYRQMLQEAGVHVEFHDFLQSTHGFTYEKSTDALKAHALMADFIGRYI